jgi:predicted ribonuclease YlaK
LKYKTFSSSWLGDIKPMAKDPYQALLADSLMRNKLTMVRGKAGSGKTLLALSYLLH